MKKIVLLASACTLAFLAGCTRENPTEGVKPEKGGITFMGSFDTDETKVYIGDYTDGAKNIPIYWENNDEIGIKFTFASMEAAGIYDNYKYYASTQEPSTTTAFHTEDWNKVSFEPGYMAEEPNPDDEVTFAAYYPFGFGNNGSSIPSPLKAEQSYDVYQNKATDQMFMIAINEAGKLSEVQKESTVIDLKFTNAFALVNIGVKGTATIDKITLKGATSPLSYEGATIDLYKAPAKGTNAADFISGGFLKPATETGEQGGDSGNEPAPTVAGDPISGESVSLVLSYPLALTSETAWLPLMVPPFSFDTATGLTIEIEGTDKQGAKQVITKTIGKDAQKSEITTNSILYIELKDITATELGQDEPKTTWQPGDEVFKDDFHWITELPEWENSDQYNTNGWISSYDNNVPYRKYNHIKAEQLSLLSHGYVYSTAGQSPATLDNLGLYSYDGMMQVGSDNGNGELIIPMTDVMSATPVDLAVKFRAARYAYRYGTFADGSKELSNEIPVIVEGNGKIKGTQETEYVVTPADPFTWYDYTVVFEGVTSDSKIVFGKPNTDPNVYGASCIFYLDNIEILIASDGDATSEPQGAKVEPEASQLLFSNINDQGDADQITLNPVKDIQSTAYNAPKVGSKWEFAVSGTWKLDVTNLPEWLSISSVSWSNNSDPIYIKEGWEILNPEAKRHFDDKGNQMTNIFWITATEDNDSEERSWDLKLLNSKDEVIKTINIIQPKASALETIYNMDFGTQTDAAVAINQDNLNDATLWGVGEYDPSWIAIPMYTAPVEAPAAVADPTEGANPYLVLSNATEQDETNGTYEGATPGGNLRFVQQYKAGDAKRSIAMFKLDIPMEKIDGKKYLYLDFGLYANLNEKNNYGQSMVGNFIAMASFSDEIPDFMSVGSTFDIYNELIQGWQYKSVRTDIPEDATACYVYILADQSYNDPWPSSGDKDLYRIDDLKISVR